jgi:hypothetical protein
MFEVRPDPIKELRGSQARSNWKNRLEEQNIAKKKGQRTAAPFRNQKNATVDLLQTFHEIRLGSVCPVV